MLARQQINLDVIVVVKVEVNRRRRHRLSRKFQIESYKKKKHAKSFNL